MSRSVTSRRPTLADRFTGLHRLIGNTPLIAVDFLYRGEPRVLYAKQDFIARNPNTVQALVNAFYKTLKWLESATPEQVTATVPEEYWLGDKALYAAAVKASKPAYSVTGIIPAAGMKSASDMLVAFDDELKSAKFDLAKTFDDRFVKKAAGL